MRKPSKRQLEWVKEYIRNDQNGTQAAMTVYKPKNRAVASQIAQNNRRSPVLRDALETALAKQGLSLDSIAETIAVGIAAVKYRWVPGSENEEGYYVKTNMPDHIIRHKYLTSLIDVTGVKSPTKTEIAFTGILAVGQIDEIRKRVLAQQN